MVREKFLIENDAKFLTGWPIFGRIEYEDVVFEPMPGAVHVRLKFDALDRRLFQVVEARGRFAEVNSQSRELEILFQLRHFDRRDFDGDTMRLRQMRVPMPSPRARAQDGENCQDRGCDQTRISEFESVPTLADSAQPARRSPGNIAEDLSGDSPEKCSDRGECGKCFGERRGCFHEGDTAGPRKSFTDLFL